MVVHTEVPLKTSNRAHWLDITKQVDAVLKNSNARSGVCLVSSQHTTAGLTINENADPDVQRDFFWKLNSVFPQESAFAHREGNSDSHIKASLVGFSVQVPVVNGALKLGTWQSIYFCEFDGPRNRIVTVSFVGE